MEIVIGFLVALLIGLTGVGAGIVTTPLLIILLGVDPSVAVGTALIFSFIIKSYTGFLYFLHGLYEKRVLILLLLGGIPGVLLGSYSINFLSINKDAVLVILGTIVFISATANLFFSLKKVKPFHTKEEKLITILPAVSFLIGLEVGFSSVGAGILVELFLISFTSLRISTVIGTSLIFGSAVSLAGGIVHFSLGNYSLETLGGLLLGGLAGSFLATKVVSAIPQQVLRYALLSFLVLLGGVLIGRGMHI